MNSFFISGLPVEQIVNYTINLMSEKLHGQKI